MQRLTVDYLVNGEARSKKSGFAWLEWDGTLSFLDGGILRDGDKYILGYSDSDLMFSGLSRKEILKHLKISQDVFHRKHLSIRILS